MKKKSHSIFAVLALALVIAAAIVVFALIRKYTPSKEHEDLTTYYHLTNSDEVAIVLNNEVTSSKARVIDGHIYIDYDFVHDNLNSRFYWDNNENILLYATTQNLISAQAEQTSYMVTKSSADYGRKIVTINSDTAYIDLDFVKEYSDFKYKHVKDPHRIIITSQWGKYQTATAKKNASLRVRGGIKSPILKKVSSKEEVTVIEQGDNWDKVMTDDGIIGYMQKRMLSSVKEKTRKSDFTPDTFAHIKKDYNICMAWHQVTNQSANNAVSSVLANTRGINVLSPTWFYLNDNNGNIANLASLNYVNYCHNQGIEVWALVSNLENKNVDTTEVLTHTSKRQNLVNQIVSMAIQYAVGFHDRMAVHQPQHAGRRERHGINVAGERHAGLRFMVHAGEPVPAHRAGRAHCCRRDQPDRAERAHRVEHRPGRRGPSARPHRLDTARRAARLLVREHRAHVLLPLVRRQSGPAVMDAGRRHHVLPVGLHPYAG